MRKLLATLTSSLLLGAVFYPVAAQAVVTAPTGVTVESLSQEDTSPNEAVVSVTFNEVENADGYDVYAIRSGSENSILGSDPVDNGNTRTSVFSNLSSGQSYEFFVRAYEATDPPVTAEADPVAFVPKSVPFDPTPGTATGGVEEVELSWNPPTVDQTGGLPLTGYRITNVSGGVDSYVANEEATSATITGLSAGTYTFIIRAENSLGLSAGNQQFAEVAVTEVTVPDAPAQPTLEQGGGGLIASWGPPDDTGGASLTGYIVYLKKDDQDERERSVGAGTTSATFLNLVDGVYTVQVVAQNSEGSSARSVESESNQISSGLEAQTITFAAIANQTEAGSIVLSATASSGLAVGFSASGDCSLSAPTTVAFTETGICSVTAAQSGDETYAAAQSVTRTFTITIAQEEEQEEEVVTPPAGGGSSGGSGGGAAGSAPSVVVRPLVSGTSEVGRTLQVSDGSWTISNPTISYQWNRCSEELNSPTQLQVLITCDLILGATSKTYAVAQEDESAFLLASVTASDGFYSTTAFSNTISPGETIGELIEQPASDAAKATGYWTKRNGDNVKLYAKNVIGLGKVQFFMNGEEIAWIRAEDKTDPKLRVITEGPMTGASYLVRDRDLPVGKNVFEIYLNGERIERRVASR